MRRCDGATSANPPLELGPEGRRGCTSCDLADGLGGPHRAAGLPRDGRLGGGLVGTCGRAPSMFVGPHCCFSSARWPSMISFGPLANLNGARRLHAVFSKIP